MSKDNPLREGDIHFTKAQLEYLQRIFVPITVAPGMSLDQIFHDAGRQDVISTIAKKVIR